MNHTHKAHYHNMDNHDAYTFVHLSILEPFFDSFFAIELILLFGPFIFHL